MPFRRPIIKGIVRTVVVPVFIGVAFPGPALAETRTWIVRSGDALSLVAERFGVSVDQLRQWNELQDDKIRVGQELKLESSPAAGAAAAGEIYRVVEGDTLSHIAKRHGVSVDELIRFNPGIDPERIRAGQTLCVAEGLRRVTFRVNSGDTLSAIAKRYRVTVPKLMRWNARLDRNRIRVGHVLTIYTDLPESYTESVGAPNHGRLKNARRLRSNPGYVIRDRERAWGTEETVKDIAAAFDALRRLYPGSPRVMVHDLSLRTGGRMHGHHSHQSGRDADIAYFQRDCGPRPCAFRRIGPAELDVKRQWALFHYWLRRNRVEAIFVDYRLQKPLYRLAKKQGATREQLNLWFQYPRGIGHPAGIIRHFRKHADHLHVRFTCHHTDTQCRSFRPLLRQARRLAAAGSGADAAAP